MKVGILLRVSVCPIRPCSDHGVFGISNGGTTWTSIDSGLIDTTITTLAASANYLWVGTSSQGVWRRSLTQIIITGTNEFSDNSSFSVYPNPATDKIFIESSSFNNTKEQSISLYNLYGQLILQQTMPMANICIDISQLPSGTYMLKINDDKKSLVRKIVKE